MKNDNLVRGFVSDIFEEIDSELKQEKFIKIISKYMPYALVVFVLMVVIIAIKMVWSNYELSLQEKYSNIFNTATTSLNNADDAILNESLNYLINLNQKNIFSTLATFQKAALELNNKHTKEAIAFYDTIYKNKNANESLRQLSGLLSIAYSIENGTNKDDIKLLFQNINKINGPFNSLIQLEKALWLIENKDTKSATEILQNLKNDETSSAFIHKTTEEILTVVQKDK